MAAFWKPNSKVLSTRQQSFITVSIVPKAVVYLMRTSVSIVDALSADALGELPQIHRFGAQFNSLMTIGFRVERQLPATVKISTRHKEHSLLEKSENEYI